MHSPAARTGTGPVILGLLAVQLFFGVHYLAAKLVLEEMPPRGWAFCRIFFAALVLWGCVALFRRPLPREPRVYVQLAIYALFGVVINQICFVEGLSRTTPIHSSLMNTTIPLSTLAFAVLLGRENLRAEKLIALAVALFGVLLILRPWAASEADRSIQVGDLLTLVNATSFSFFLAISKRTMEKIDALSGTAILLTFGSIGVAPLALPQLAGVQPSALSDSFWWLAAFIILLPTAAAYLINYWALGKVDSSLVAFFIFVQPSLAATLSWIVLGERPDRWTYVGAALVFCGVAWTLRRRR